MSRSLLSGSYGLTTLPNMFSSPLVSPVMASREAWMFSCLDILLQGMSQPASCATKVQ